MEEKNLLNEITYLSRLICKHKQSMRSNPSFSYHQNIGSKSLVNTKTSYRSYRDTSQYRKINSLEKLKSKGKQGQQPQILLNTQSQACAQQSISKPAAVTCPDSKGASSVSSQDHVNKNPSTSIHINPQFFNDKILNNEKSSTTSKNIYINPKVLTVRTNTCRNVARNEKEERVLPPKTVSQTVSNSSEKKPTTAQAKCTSTRKKYIYRTNTKIIKAAANASPSYPAATKVVKTPHGGGLLAVSRMKLVRIPQKVKKTSVHKVCAASLLVSSPLALPASKGQLKWRKALFTQPSQSVKMARKVCSKYRLRNVSVSSSGSANSSKYHLDRRVNKTPRGNLPGRACVKTTYHIDRRAVRTPKPRKYFSRAVKSVRKSYLPFSPARRRFPFGNRVWAQSGSTPAVQQHRKIFISHKKLRRIGNYPSSGERQQNSSLVRIGGVLYKTSRTKLTRSQSSGKASPLTPKARTVVKRCRLAAGRALYICGNKFVMDRSGHTLRRVPDAATPAASTSTSSFGSESRGSCRSRRTHLSRIDIGGVTYIQKTPTMLVRTNTHAARNFVSSVKQRSIALLTKKLRKNNQPCAFFRRFGRCPRQEKGRCDLVHDPRCIAICKKFLQGKCEIIDCLLSHDVVPEKMPTCKYFLEGCCVRDNCPYLHVKVSDKAPICRDFLQGYCSEGTECLKRHIMLCPEFDKKGSCRKGKYCPYPHPTLTKASKAQTARPKKTKETNEVEEVQQKRKRYYESESLLEELNCDKEQDDCKADNNEGDVGFLRKRPKIGELPSFIALESNLSS